MTQQEHDTLDKIFNKSTVTIKGKALALRFTISAELYLERFGIHLGTLAGLMAKEPTTTILRLVFAGLPPEEYRDKMTFEAFCADLPEADGKKILVRVDWILSCYFRHLLGEYEKQKADQENGNSVKKN